MTEHEASILIARDPEFVWRYVSDLSSTPQWRTTVHSVDPPELIEPGVTFGATTKLMGATWQWRLVIDEFDPPRSMTYSVAEGFTDITVTYRLAPADDGTRFTMLAASRPRRRIERMFEPIAARALRRQIDRQLVTLREIVEHLDHPPE